MLGVSNKIAKMIIKAKSNIKATRRWLPDVIVLSKLGFFISSILTNLAREG
jgi:hypothetical protein